jgi:epoxyqueuosine reductase
MKLPACYTKQAGRKRQPMGTAVSELIESLSRNGCQARVVSISRVEEMERTLLGLKASGDITLEFYPEIIKYFKFDWSAMLASGRSIIITASPQLPSRVTFGSRSVIIPPTYIHREIWHKQMELVKGFLEPLGHKVSRARLPFKTLAVRSGLAMYGRNNIAYIPGMGSFFRLAAFYSDLPCNQDSWGPPQTLSNCVKCRICADECPTGCISTSRFLVHAERCLTHFNEQEKPIPEWISPSWHNSLLGCMACQQSCTLNKKLMEKIENRSETFDYIETSEILSGTPKDKLRGETLSKLESLCLAGDVYPLLKRNLSLVLDRA